MNLSAADKRLMVAAVIAAALALAAVALRQNDATPDTSSPRAARSAPAAQQPRERTDYQQVRNASQLQPPAYWLGRPTASRLVFSRANVGATDLLYVSVADAGLLDAGKDPTRADTIQTRAAPAQERAQLRKSLRGKSVSSALGRAVAVSPNAAVVLTGDAVINVSVSEPGRLKRTLARLQRVR